MANTGNSANASTEVYKPTPSLMYPYWSRTLLAKFREPMVFAMGAENLTPENIGNTNKYDFHKFGEIPRGGKLVETDKVPLHNLTASKVTMTMYEYGNGVLITEAARKWNQLDPMSAAIEELSFDARKTHDNSIRDAYYTTTNSKFAGNKTLATLAAGDRFSFSLMNDLVTLARTQKMFPFQGASGSYFLCYISPIQHQQLINEIQGGDSDAVKAKMWLPVASYAQDTPMMGEVGRYQNIRFIMTPELWQGNDPDETDSYKEELDADTSGTAVDTQTALLTGRQGVAYYDQMLPKLRLNSEDFNRLEEAAWVAYWGTQIRQTQSVLKIYTSSDVTVS